MPVDDSLEKRHHREREAAALEQLRELYGPDADLLELAEQVVRALRGGASSRSEILCGLWAIQAARHRLTVLEAHLLDAAPKASPKVRHWEMAEPLEVTDAAIGPRTRRLRPLIRQETHEND